MKKFSVFCLAMLPVVFGGCGSEPEPKPPRRVKTMQVLDASSLSTREFPGRADPGQEVNLSFRVGGPLIELPVNVGDRVEAGTLVARIDPTDYESAVKGVEAELQMAQAAARRAQADLGRIEATFRDDPGATSQTARDRARQLRDATDLMFWANRALGEIALKCGYMTGSDMERILRAQERSDTSSGRSGSPQRGPYMCSSM